MYLQWQPILERMTYCITSRVWMFCKANSVFNGSIRSNMYVRHVTQKEVAHVSTRIVSCANDFVLMHCQYIRHCGNTCICPSDVCMCVCWCKDSALISRLAIESYVFIYICTYIHERYVFIYICTYIHIYIQKWISHVPYERVASRMSDDSITGLFCRISSLV